MFSVYELTAITSCVFVSQILEISIALIGLGLTIWSNKHFLLWSPVIVSQSFQYQYNIMQRTNTEFSSISILQFIIIGAITVLAAHTRKPRLVSVNFTALRRSNTFKGKKRLFIIWHKGNFMFFFVCVVGKILTNTQLCQFCSSCYLPPLSPFFHLGKWLHTVCVCVCLD